MFFDEAIQALLKDLPWCDEQRIIVLGKGFSTEAIKDYFIAQSPGGIIPGHAVSTLAGWLSTEVPVASLVQLTDALQMISQTDTFSARHRSARDFRDRSYARKMARLIQQLDLHSAHEDELLALAEAMADKTPWVGEPLLDFIKAWRQSQDMALSEAVILRTYLNQQNSQSDIMWKGALWILGTGEASLLERQVLDRLKQHVQVYQEPTVSRLTAHYERWRPHTPWDEIEALVQTIVQAVTTSNVVPQKIAVFVPNDPIYKRMVRDRLMQENIPLRDPSLSSTLGQSAEALWWRDMLRALAMGFPRDSVLALLSSARLSDATAEIKLCHQFAQLSSESGARGSLSIVRRLAEKIPHPVLQLLVMLSVKLTKRLPVVDMTALLSEVVESTKTLAQNQGWLNAPSGDVLLRFAENLRDRIFLQNKSLRLSALLPLFEEYVNEVSVLESPRAAQGGVWLQSHGTRVPQGLEKVFVLGAGTIGPRTGTSDIFDIESTATTMGEVTSAKELAHHLWMQLNHEYDPLAQAERRRQLYNLALVCAPHVVVSEPCYDFNGAQVPEQPWLAEVFPGLQAAGSADTASLQAAGSADTASLQAAGSADTASLWAAGLPYESQIPQVVDASYSCPDQLSVTAFEDYLKCPFLYYGRHVLRLEEIQDVGLEPDARVKGQLLHEIFESTLTEEITRGTLPPWHWVVKNAEELYSKTKLFGMYRDQALKNAYWRSIMVILQSWYRYEESRRADFPEFKPWRLELKLEYVLNEGLTLRGRVDRVDRSSGGLVVIDYKSGASSFSGKELVMGFGAQLLMYGALLQNREQLPVAAAFYLKTGRNADDGQGVFVGAFKKIAHSKTGQSSGYLKQESFDDVVGRAQIRWQQAATALKKGVFSPQPYKTKICENCSFKHLCGYPQNQESTP
jgi:RecB family exonuclease